MSAVQLESMEVEVDPTFAVVMRQSCAADPVAIKAAMGSTFGALGAWIGAHNITPAGPPRAIYTAFDATGISFTVAFPVGAPLPIAEAGPITVEKLPGGRALRFVHRGPYDAIRATYDQIEAWLRERGAMKSSADWAKYSPMWEEFMNDPGTTPSADLVTRIYLPLHAAAQGA
jgi:effector-binding domain-containing protein